jgi:hypothetical protein
MLASGPLQGAEGERLQSGVADRRLRATSELPADSPAACTFLSSPSSGRSAQGLDERRGRGAGGRRGQAGGAGCHPRARAVHRTSVRAPLAVSVNTRYQPARWRSSTLQVRLLVGGGDAGVAEQMSHAHDGRRTLDRPGCATLILDTGSGRVKPCCGRGRGGCHRTFGFGQVTCDARESLRWPK